MAYKCDVWVWCGAVGAVMIVMAVLSLPLVQYVVKTEVHKHLQLTEGTVMYPQWENPSVPIYLKVYVFNVTNEMEVLNGGKPKLVEVGPFVYREIRNKTDIKHNSNGTVTYRQIKTYHFNRELSVASDSEVFTTVNLVLMALAQALRYESDIMQNVISSLLGVFHEDALITLSVQDIMWGYEDKLLRLAKSLYPKWFYTDLVGAMAGKNSTDDGVYTVFTGEDDMSQIGWIDKYNGSSYLHFWSTKFANKINGSDGSVFPPFLDNSFIPYFFDPQVCRASYAVFNGTMTTSQGLELIRFTVPPELMMAPPGNPDNAGFCVPAGDCMPSGVLNITSCMIVDHFPIPLMLSLPHFYLGEARYREAVKGMKPDAKKHSMFVGLEPVSGVPMSGAKRIQVNIYVENLPQMKQLKKLKTVVFPLLWIDENMQIDDNNAHLVWSMLLLPLQIVHVIQYSAIVIGVALFVCASTSLLHDLYTKRNLARLTSLYTTGVTSAATSQPGTDDEHTEREPLLSSVANSDQNQQ